jgi:dihydroorotase
MRFAVMVALMSAAAWGQPRYDLVLKGGRVIDPQNGVDAVRDIAVKDGKIAAVAAEIPAAEAKQALDVRGLLLTPGLVDMHVHLFSTTGVANAWAGDNSVRPDDFSFRTGVTTMADAGSAGWQNFETFRHTVIDRAQTRVYAFVNIARLGMLTLAVEQYEADLQPQEVARVAKKHRDVVVGVKIAHWEAPDWTQVERGLEAGRLAAIPMMVDFGFFRKERPFYELAGSRLRPGDIATHAYRSGVPWVDENGKLYGYLGAARKRGVIFDVGHGGGSLVFRNAVPAVEQGFWPDTISTDLHTGSMNAAMMDLPTTMAKFLALGMPLKEVVAAATHKPAAVIGHPEHGHLTVGAAADVAAWRLAEGDYGFADTSGGTIRGKQRLECELTLRAGRIAWDRNARGGADYRKLGASYGVREGEYIVPPPKR